MLYPTSPEARRRRRLIVIVGATAFLVSSFVTCAALVHHPASRIGHAAPRLKSNAASTVAPEPRVVELPRLRPTRDPETFARLVAQALFEWDSATMTGRDAHIEQLIAVGDPTGESTAGLLEDLDNYLPTPKAWIDLGQYDTKQWLSLDSATTPAQWAEAETQASDELLPGTTALTIRGVRHRSGVWEGASVTSEHDVAFTVFIVCAPSYRECHLLRLSMLDKPLA